MLPAMVNPATSASAMLPAMVNPSTSAFAMLPAMVNPSAAPCATVPDYSESFCFQDDAEVKGFQQMADDLVSHTDKLGIKVSEIMDSYNGKRHGSSVGGISALKRSPDLMRQFSAILQQITNDSMAEPFIKPVDVEGLGLFDYYQIIKKPMCLSTILKKMDANDGSAYQSIREIYSDVKLVFLNAMEYNNPSHFIHQMAKSLLDKFELKCRHLMPKIIDEESRQKEDHSLVAANAKVTPEASVAKLAWETDNELNRVNMLLEELREKVYQKCRKMTTEGKKKLSSALRQLPTEELKMALEIVAKDNPDFCPGAEEVNLDLDAQSETTLWRLMSFVNDSLEREAKNAAEHALAKRKRDISNAIATNKIKKSKKQP